MFEVSKDSMFARLAMAVCLAASPCAVHAQATTVPIVATPANAVPSGDIQISLTYDVGDANLTSTTPFSFLLQGGSVELEAKAYKGLGVVGSFTGMHSSNSGQGIPINLLIFAFGPRYTLQKGHGKHSLQFYGQSVLGEADGFNGFYPSPGAPLTSANSLALQTGGGIDVRLTPHFSVRALQADWLRTYLPDSRQNVENTFRMGVGFVFHTTRQ